MHDADIIICTIVWWAQWAVSGPRAMVFPRSAVDECSIMLKLLETILVASVHSI